MSEASIVQIIVASIIAVIGALVGAAKWVLWRTESRLERHDERISRLERDCARQDWVERIITRFEARIDEMEKRMTDRLDRIIDGRK